MQHAVRDLTLGDANLAAGVVQGQQAIVERPHSQQTVDLCAHGFGDCVEIEHQGVDVAELGLAEAESSDLQAGVHRDVVPIGAQHAPHRCHGRATHHLSDPRCNGQEVRARVHEEEERAHAVNGCLHQEEVVPPLGGNDHFLLGQVDAACTTERRRGARGQQRGSSDPQMHGD